MNEEAKLLRENFTYDPKTGEFWTKPRKVGCVNPDGYLCVNWNGKVHRLHRLAFLYMDGEWPKKSIDHINRVRDDNRWVNLRQATPKEQSSNAGKQKKHPDPTFEEVSMLYRYDPEEGVFYSQRTGRVRKPTNKGNHSKLLSLARDSVSPTRFITADKIAILLMTGKYIGRRGKTDHKDGNQDNFKWDNIETIKDYS